MAQYILFRWWLCCRAVVALMRRNGYGQDDRYAAGAGMRRSGDGQDDRYAAGAGMCRSGGPLTADG
jgi:hypothetical protein